MTAMRLISSDMPCTSSNVNPMMISDLAGHCGKPACVARLLVDLDRAHEERAAGDDHDDAERHQKNRMTDEVDAVAQLLGQHIVDDIDPDMLVVEQRPATSTAGTRC